MMRNRYSILVLPHFGDEYELCTCGSNPEKLANAIAERPYPGVPEKRRKSTSLKEYVSIRIIDRGPTDTPELPL
jgi:hypothetical protein